MPDSPPELPDETAYHLAPAIAARVVGGLLVALALLLAVGTVVVAVADLPLGILAAVVLVGVVAVVGVHLASRRVPVVRFDRAGYQVRWVRGAGVRAAAWTEVTEAVTATTERVPVVVLRLEGGRTTTIPVQVLDVDRERFVRDLQAHLQRGQGLRPLR
ncbi:hypothetical protein GON03_12715 [Nocardioides sp. MAH-18]|uniref:Uncharacterized protein n=1 Tax=Nocardioides agri TaxID=2682843 RepID=A0A6L6XU98_9ACTN|nr:MULTISPECIES: hypothetical protein [unclassified Nocardioides]MBA2955195.1 hypothetical protein [Nocardioides sp. CGMCC 1.13656]MVQ50046.1 hypothetical protein [Nocardioides sp. MAH-18]